MVTEPDDPQLFVSSDDDGDDDGDGDEIVPSSAVGRFRRNTTAGAILNGVALGLRDVFDPVVKEEAPIIQDAPGEPVEPKPVDVDYDPDDPTASRVLVRPHLFDRDVLPTHDEREP